MKMPFKIALILVLLTTLNLGVSSQTTNVKSNKRPADKPKAVITASPQPTPEAETPSAKRNERPDGNATPTDKTNLSKPLIIAQSTVYSYIFTRPGFSYSRIAIDHDDTGKGQISMQKSSFDEPIVDPIELSPVTLGKIKDAISGLRFLDSNEEYQVTRDYSHMGNIEFRMKKDGRERAVKYNWTENKDAKILMDEYRRISNEYTWRFEILLARQNQPLLTPGLMDLAESYYKRGELPDPPHLVPFLLELSNDERLPLMARNRAAKMIKEIEKSKK